MSARTEALVETLQAGAQLSIRSAEGKGSVPLLVVAALPAKAHVEQLDFFGSPDSVLITDGASFGLIQKGRFYRGSPNRENLARFIPLPVSPEELALILLGRAPRLSRGDVSAGEEQGAGGLYAVVLKSEQGTQRLWIQPSTFRVVKSQVEGPVPYELEFGDFGGRDQAYFPRKIVLTDLATHSRFELHYGDDLVLNPQIDPQTFVPRVPSQAQIIELGRNGS